MDLRKAKIGTLLSMGIIAIIGLMITASIYSNYLSNSAQNIIRNSTTRIFDVLTIQRDVEELFSALDELVLIQDKQELKVESENINALLQRAQNTVREGGENEIFKITEVERAEEILNDATGVIEHAIELKENSIDQRIGVDNDFSDTEIEDANRLNTQFIMLRNIRFDMLEVVNNIINQSDEEFRNAMDLVHRAQMLTWIVISISVVLASLLAFFLIRSAKKIYDLKNEFVNIIAHDLRNPVTAINGYLDIITTGKEPSKNELNESLQAITVSAQKLTIQINNLLEVGRTEAGHIKLNLEAVQPFDVIKESIVRAKALAETSGIKINYVKTNEKDIFVSADRSKLSDVLDNLISNAIKYNKKNGTVTISTEDKGELFSISVSDTGSGIPEEQKHKIFKKYTRLGTDENKKVGGTGLGLYTVKLSMDKMKGTVMFESKENVGTKFIISLKKANKK